MKVITGQLDYLPVYDLRSICPVEEMLLFDIETTGLKKETTQVYLIGCAWFQDDVWNFRQYLTESTMDEYDILESFLDFASDFRTLVHFNGDGFDIPYIQYKCEYYRTEKDLSRFQSFDIYKAAKCARRFLGVSSMSQKSVEQFLGVRRDDQYNGGLLIPVYYDYERTGSPEKEEILLLHNHDDLLGMLKILPILAYRDMITGGFTFDSVEEIAGVAVLNYKLQTHVPVDHEYTGYFLTKGKGICLSDTPEKKCESEQDGADLMIVADRDLLQINLRIRQGTGLVPLENISDYYYLPEEDRVIHKEVAQFLERSRRVKATKKNCVLKKEGRFILQPGGRLSPVYCLGEDRKQIFADWEEMKENIQKNDPGYRETLNGMAQDILDLVSSL